VLKKCNIPESQQEALAEDRDLWSSTCATSLKNLAVEAAEHLRVHTPYDRTKDNYISATSSSKMTDYTTSKASVTVYWQFGRHRPMIRSEPRLVIEGFEARTVIVKRFLLVRLNF